LLLLYGEGRGALAQGNFHSREKTRGNPGGWWTGGKGEDFSHDKGKRFGGVPQLPIERITRSIISI